MKLVSRPPHLLDNLSNLLGVTCSQQVGASKYLLKARLPEATCYGAAPPVEVLKKCPIPAKQEVGPRLLLCRPYAWLVKKEALQLHTGEEKRLCQQLEKSQQDAGRAGLVGQHTCEQRACWAL